MIDLSLAPPASAAAGNDPAFSLTELPKLLNSVATQISGLSLSPDKQTPSGLRLKVDHFIRLMESSCKIFVTISDLCRGNRMSMEEQSNLYQIIQSIPAFIEDVLILLKEENVTKLKHIVDANKLIVSRAKFVQSAMFLVSTYYKSEFISNERRFRIIFDNINKTEFIVRLDDEHLLQRDLSKFLSKQICSEQQFELVLKAIEEAYELKRNSIKEMLARQRILQFIGFPKEKYIADQIEQLAEIMPDLSRQQIHLCLRHFGYDFENTLAALCEREQLPLNLKILLRTKDKLEDITGGKRKIDMYSDDELGNTWEMRLAERAELEKEINTVEELVVQLGIDEATLEVNGKILVRRMPHEKERTPTAKERQALVAASLTLADEMEIEERPDAQSDDEEADEHLNDLKLAAEVGKSGRFNREMPTYAIDGADVYDDEFDDTYDQAETYEAGLNAASLDEKEPPPTFDRWPNEDSKNQRPQTQQQTRPSANPPKVASTAGPSNKTNNPTTFERRIKRQNKGKGNQKAADKKKMGLFL